MADIFPREIVYEAFFVEKPDHTPAAVVKENEVKVTCTKAGSYDAVTKQVCPKTSSSLFAAKSRKPRKYLRPHQIDIFAVVL